MSDAAPPLRVRPHLDSLPPYTPIEPFEVLSRRLGRASSEIVKLDANENPYGPSPQVHKALGEMAYTPLYPDPESRLLREALAEFSCVPVQNLLAGSGADELLDLLVRTLVEPGETVLSCPPTFGMYAFDTLMNAGELVEVPRKPDFSLDLPAIRSAVQNHRPRIIFLASPNNPDGSMLPEAEFEELLRLPALLVLDEAYIEFSGSGRLGAAASRIRRVSEAGNLVVLRTFSKWAGLAGLRVGYGAFPDWLMPVLWKAKQPYNVNVAASTAALASLADLEPLETNLIRLLAERERLYAALEGFEWLSPYPTRANFILCRVRGIEAAELKHRLAVEHGILVRYFSKPGLQDHIRVSVGRPHETQAFLAALNRFDKEITS